MKKRAEANQKLNGRSHAELPDLPVVVAGNVITDETSVVEGLARGVQAAAEGRAVSHAQAKARLSRWLY